MHLAWPLSVKGLSRVWCGQIVSELQEASLSQEQVELFWEMYHEARGQLDSQRKESSEAVHAPGLALSTVGRLLTILHLMYQVRSRTRSSAVESCHALDAQIHVTSQQLKQPAGLALSARQG